MFQKFKNPLFILFSTIYLIVFINFFCFKISKIFHSHSQIFGPYCTKNALKSNSDQFPIKIQKPENPYKNKSKAQFFTIKKPGKNNKGILRKNSLKQNLEAKPKGIWPKWVWENININDFSIKTVFIITFIWGNWLNWEALVNWVGFLKLHLIEGID